MLTISNLAANQRRAIKDAITKGNSVITSDCGFGKTIVALMIARYFAKKDGTTLIVGKAQGVKGTWSQEHLNWEQTKNLRVVVLSGAQTPAQRALLLSQPADIWVCAYGLMGWLLKQKKLPTFSAVIADEASCLKGSSSKYRSNLQKLSVDTQLRLAMTATPKTRNEDDYWGICRWADGGEALGKTIGEFRARYMHSISIPNTRGVLWKMRSGAGDDVREAIKHLFLEYELEGSAEVPFVTRVVKRDLKPESQAVYDEFREKGVLAGTVFKDGEPLSKLEIQNYLTQLSSGFVYEETLERLTLADLEGAKSAVQLIKQSKSRTPREIFTDRIDLMKEVYAKINGRFKGEPILICYQYKYELTQLKGLFPDALEDTTPNFQKLWNTGNYAVGLLQYQRSSKAVNLQKACRLMVQYSQTFNFEDNYQIPRRIARQGQTKKVYVIKLHFNGTVDELKTDKQLERQTTHDQFRKMVMR